MNTTSSVGDKNWQVAIAVTLLSLPPALISSQGGTDFLVHSEGHRRDESLWVISGGHIAAWSAAGPQELGM